MKNIKLWFQAFVIVSVAWFSTMGCATRRTWQGPSGETNPSYKDNVTSIYYKPSSNEIVIASEKYHYIFSKQSSEIIELFKHGKFLDLKQSNFIVYDTMLGKRGTDFITAKIQIRFPPHSLDFKQQDYLLKQDFTVLKKSSTKNSSTSNRNTAMYMHNYTISGKRYLANPKINKNLLKLKYTMDLYVSLFQKEDTEQFSSVELNSYLPASWLVK